MSAPHDVPTGGVALIYTRVSSPGQERDGESLETQEEACRALAAQKGYTVGAVVREVYRGAELFDRPQMTQVRADLRARRYAALIVFTTSRLARNPVHQAIIVEEAMRGGAVVEMVHEPLDTSPEGLLIAYVRGYAAQIDRERIRTQTLAGRRRRVEQGKIHNVGVDLYGYHRDREAGVRVVYEPEAQIVRRIFTLCAVEHRGLQTIARILTAEGIPSPDAGRRGHHATTHWPHSTVRAILRNPAYRGETMVWRWRSEVVTSATPRRREGDLHREPRRSQYQPHPRPPEEHLRMPDGVTPAIVDDELWFSAQLALTERVAQPVAKYTALPYLLRGMLRCGVCGRAMHARTIHDRRYRVPTQRRMYRCASQVGGALAESCHGPLIAADAIEAWVWQEVRAILHAEDVLRRETETTQRRTEQAQRSGGRDALQAEHARVEAALARVERLQARTLTRYNTVDDEAIMPWSLVEAELARLTTERTAHAKRLTELDAALHAAELTAARRASVRERVTALARDLDALDAPQRADDTAEDERWRMQRRRLLESLNVRLTGNGAVWSLYLEVIAGDTTTTLLRLHRASD